MAIIYVKSGQTVTSTTTENEVRQYPPYARDMKFEVTSGGVQVTTGPYFGTGIIGGSIRSYATDDKDIMSVEPAGGSTIEGTAIFIKGVGDITFSW
jgi:hypothetical protein